MSKKLLLIVLTVFFSSSALAAPNVGGCGWGSKLMAGQEGIAPQVMAVTTNGTSGNQTFGISSGTSGCTQTGVVNSNWKTAMFIDGNVTKLARDMSVGQGEALDSLARLLGMDEQQQRMFSRVAQKNFERIFPSDHVSSAQVMGALREVMLEHDELAPFAEEI